jgi:hypothetical protein
LGVSPAPPHGCDMSSLHRLDRYKVLRRLQAPKLRFWSSFPPWPSSNLHGP